MDPIGIPSLRLMALILVGVLACPASGRAGGLHEKGDTPPVISHGSKVDLEDYLVPGKTTIFDFYSIHCPTCMSLKPGLERLHASRPDIAVVMVDVDRPGSKGIDWESPVAKQHGLPSTPQFRVFGPDGKLQAKGRPAYDLVTGWIK
jgi:thiol-disulfide isomerase/thioredoxin